MLQRIALHCNTLHYAATHCTTLPRIALHCDALHYTATHCTTLQHIALHCNALHYAATHCTTLQRIALHCNTLHYTIRHHSRLSPSVPCLWITCNEFVRDQKSVAVRCSWGRGIIRDLNSSSHLHIRVLKGFFSVLQCVAVCCRELQCVVVCCSVMQYIAVRCSWGRGINRNLNSSSHLSILVLKGFFSLLQLLFSLLQLGLNQPP